jgi:hypothetical protein
MMDVNPAMSGPSFSMTAAVCLTLALSSTGLFQFESVGAAAAV